MNGQVNLRQWIGRTESRRDLISGWPVKALAATLDRQDPEPADGSPVPDGGHWLYFLDAKPASELGSDGHPARGGFLPPVPLPRRMWAGGRIDFVRPLRIGEAAQRDSEILKVEEKSGASGKLVFVTVRHTVMGSGEIAIIEEQDIVYRDAAKPGDAPPPGKTAPCAPEWSRCMKPDPVLLFRYSALTFNGHRIHYDKDYATGEEHYHGLVVHGPLQTTLLLDLCRRYGGRPLKRLEYRAMSPLFHDHTFTVNGHPEADGTKAELWTANADGHYAMRGTAHF